jgi:hypothetical protein
MSNFNDTMKQESANRAASNQLDAMNNLTVEVSNNTKLILQLVDTIESLKAKKSTYKKKVVSEE